MRFISHKCMAKGCTVQVQPICFMCGDHWSMLSSKTQDALWKAYTPGQEHDLERITPTYLKVALDAIEEVDSNDG